MTMPDVMDFGQADILHRVRWRSGGAWWTEGPQNLEGRFGPVLLRPGVVYRMRLVAPARRVERLLVQIGTCHGRHQGVLACRVLTRRGAVLDSAVHDTAALEDCGFANLASLAGLRPGQSYVVELRLTADAGAEIALFVASGNGRAAGLDRRLEGAGQESDAPFGPERRVVLARIADGDERHERGGLAAGGRVVVCTHGLPPGGAERQWIYLADGLQQAGYDVQVLLYDAPRGETAHYLPLLRGAGLRLRHLCAVTPPALRRTLHEDSALEAAIRSRMVADPDRLARMVTALRQIRPQAVFAQLDDTNLYAGLAALLADVPRVVVSFRNHNPAHFPHIFQDWFLDVYRLLAGSPRVVFTGNSAAGNADYENWLGLARGRTHCIANAVSRAHFAAPRAEAVAQCRRALGLARGHTLLLGVFRLSPEKNPAGFVAVCEKLMQSRAGLRAAIAGVGPMASALEAQISASGLQGRIVLLGRRSDIDVLMAAASLLLLASDREGMPNVLLEAQAMGLPVVSTDTGATRTAMLPGVSGHVCEAGDLDGLAAACGALLDDPAKAREMGEAGRRHAQATFGIGAMAERYAALCRAPAPARGAARPMRRWAAGLLLPAARRAAGLALQRQDDTRGA